MNTFFWRRVSVSLIHIRSVRKGNTKVTSLLHFIRPGLFLSTTQSVNLMETQAIDKANDNTVPSFL